MKNKFLHSIICLLLGGTSLFAQHQFSGTVIDAKENGVFYATVALYNQADSTLVSAASTEDDGTFEIKKIKDGAYFLKTNMLGYDEVITTDVVFPRDHQKAFSIQLLESANDLETVEVTAKLPLLEQKSDRMVVNVENNITGMNNNVLDVMKKVPGVLVTGDKIRMAGQSTVTILINGKSTDYMDMESLLRDMPGDNIKKVEVIHQPGAEFPAEGTGAILNIILKKNSLFGTNGQVSAGVGRGYADWKYRSSVSLSHYQGNVNIHGGFGYRNSPYYDRMTIVRNVAGDIYEQVSVNPQYSEGIRGNLSLDWDITDQHRVGFSSRLYDSRSDNTIQNVTNIDFKSEDETDGSLFTTNVQDDRWQFYAVNPYYTFEIDTAGQKLELDFNWVTIQNDGFSTLSEVEGSEGLSFAGLRFIQPGMTNIYTTQLDYTYPFSNALKLQVGGKYSDATLDNDLIVEDENTENEWIKNDTDSNRFIFDETIAAAYTKLTYGKDEWSGTLGLRYENSQSIGNSYSALGDSTLNRDISKIFPSASIGRDINKVLGASLAYSYRINRPRYSSLNSFVYSLDPFTSERGNQALTPAYTHSVKFSLAYEKQPFFNIEYRITNDAMIDMTEQDDETGETSLSTVNLDSYKNFNASLFFPLDFIPKVTGYGGVIANHSLYQSVYLDGNFERAKWDVTTFIQANFTLPFKIESEISGWYNSGGQEGIINSSWLYGVDVGFSKKVLNDKAKISFGVENLFARYLEADIRYLNMDLRINDRWDGPIVNFQFSYKFGNPHMKDSQKRRGSASDEINRAQKS